MLFVVSVGLLVAAAAHGSRSVTSARIAWTCGSPPRICVMNANGSNARVLPTGTAPAESPSWSPDATRIVFASVRGRALDLFAIGADGRGLRRLTKTPWNEDSPAWSTDGALIAFVSDRTGNEEIDTMRARGGAETNLTRSPGSETDPAWSPNAKGLAFASNRGGEYRIWVMSRTGTDATQLTPFAAITPAFSPDGRRIVVTGSGGLYVLDLVAGRAARLTSGRIDTEPSWSHDGRLIVFRRGTGSSAELYTIRPNGTGLRRLTHNRTPDTLPVWSAGSTS
jgi:TolB protein